MNAEFEFVATALKAARQNKGLSQRALSEKVGIPQGHISKIENAEVDPRASSLIEIARALDLELTLVPRKIMPAIRALERGAIQTDQPTSEGASVALNELNKVQKDVQALARQLPQSKDFQKLHTTIQELQRFPIDSRFAGRIRDILEQMRPTLTAIRASQKNIKNRTANSQQLRQLDSAATALRQIRNAIVHGAIEPTNRSVPAYRLNEEG